MSNPFGGFVHTSPLSSLPHDPLHSLSSNIIRDFFGPTVQTIADCLLSQCCSGGINDQNHNIANEESPGLSLSDIEMKITSLCKRTLNEEREKLVKSVNQNRFKDKNVRIRMAKGPESSGYVVDRTSIRAALLVLVQHSIVLVLRDENTLRKSNKSQQRHHDAYRYKFDPNRARFIPRYPRFVEHAKEAIDDYAGAVVEEILMHGRMRAEDIVTTTMESVYRFLSAGRQDDEDENEEEDGEEDIQKREESLKKKKEIQEAEKAEIRVGVMKSFKRLVEGGYLEQVDPTELTLPSSNSTNDKKRKRNVIEDSDDENEFQDKSNNNDETFEQDFPPAKGIPLDDHKTLTLLRKHPNSRLFPVGSVWRVSIPMFHKVLRALVLGNLIKERYEDKVPAAGSIITAALKLAAFEEHAPKQFAMSEAEKQRREEEKGIFTAEELMDFIPTPVLHAFKNKAGGGKSNIHMALVTLSQLDWPQVVMEVEGGRFELATRQMVKYLQGRVLHQVVKDHMGDVAARICSLLEVKGYLETDTIAKSAMVPVQDVREVRIMTNVYFANRVLFHFLT